MHKYNVQKTRKTWKKKKIIVTQRKIKDEKEQRAISPHLKSKTFKSTDGNTRTQQGGQENGERQDERPKKTDIIKNN